MYIQNHIVTDKAMQDNVKECVETEGSPISYSRHLRTASIIKYCIDDLRATLIDHEWLQRSTWEIGVMNFTTIKHIYSFLRYKREPHSG